MKVACILVLAACGTPGYDDFSGNWAGVLNATFSCMDGSTVQVTFASEQYNISQSGPNATISVAFCGGLVLGGTASGADLSVIPSGDTSQACTQVDANGNTITINDFAGGDFTYDGINLDANLNEDVQINGLGCSGTASGVVQPM